MNTHISTSLKYFCSIDILGAMCNVIPVKCKRVSTHTLMFWAGLGNVVFSFLCIPLPKVNLDTVFNPFSLGKYCRHDTHIQLR